MTTSFPFILDVTATATGRMLIYAENVADAHRILHEREDELIDALREQAHLPESEAIDYEMDHRGAWGYEVAGTEALTPGQFTLTLDIEEDEREANEAGVMGYVWTEGDEEDGA